MTTAQAHRIVKGTIYVTPTSNYLARCSCGFEWTGKTGEQMDTRFAAHRAASKAR